MTLLRTFSVTVLAATVAACAMTRSTQLVESGGSVHASYRTIAVVPMDGTPEERAAFEGALSAQFKSRGVTTLSSTRLAPQVTSVDGTAVIRQLKAEGAGAVLYIWVARNADSGNGDRRPGSFGWTGPVSAWYTPSGNTGAAIGRFEGRLYDLASNQEIWFGRTMTFYPKTVEIDAPQVAETVAAELASKGYFGK